MEWVNLLGQGGPVSQIQQATGCLLTIKYGMRQPSRPGYDFYPNTTGYRPVAVSFLSNMQCVNLLGQGRPVSLIPLATARVPVSFLSNMECVNLLGQGRAVSQIQLATTRVLSPSYQIWNALTFLDKVGRLAKYNWLQPGGCLLPIKYGMR
ncbi:hypothetical protein CEXT_147761 [Caerostris extrusa]|uniref:LAGLIDADG homing endonuclease n=1 Tax=Caerostris extrusa TaxID=172846 RepID=A0AAV4PDD1_CAEEX|nr:hypothetical protein CEXT_147761 [Caerostris extrusa]